MAEVLTSVCPHDCPSVCTLDIERTPEGRLGRVRGSRANPYTAGVVCAKVARYAERFHHADRLATPMRRIGAKGEGVFVPIAWEDALDATAEAMLRAEQRLGSETVWPYFYAGTMGLVQRDGIERLRHAKRYSGQYSTICTTLAETGWRAGHGTRFGAVPLEMAKADLVVIWGGNPVATQVHVMTHVNRARKERGAPLVVIDPYRSATAQAADVHLALRPGTDGALACAVMHVLFRDGYADRDYMARFADDPAGLDDHLRTRGPEWASAITGLPVQAIEDFAALYGRTERAFLRTGYGFTRSRNGAAAMHAVSSLAVVGGKWRHEGGGCLWGHGDIYHLDRTLIEGRDVRDPAIRMLDQSRIGPVLTGDARDLGDGPPVTALFVQNTNPMNVAPELIKVQSGFRRDDLFVCVHEQFMTDTARMADIVLPATMFLEHDDIYTASGHTRLQVARKLFEPFAESRSNHWVHCELARRLGAEHPGFAMTEWQIIEATLAASGWPSAEVIAQAGGHDCLPSWDVAHYTEGFGFPDGRFRFKPDWRALGDTDGVMPVFPDQHDVIDARGDAHPFRLVAAPARNYLNTSFTETPSSQAKEVRPTALLHPDDAAELGLADGDPVRLGNRQGSVLVHAKAQDGQRRGTVVVESIWPNGAFVEGIGINALISADPGLPRGGAVFHDTAVWVRPG
ncbi:molybdopterin oxidoreductase family protein [Marinivivus vitaminiproducens]|uniref:molybdopterin oxidoreductase family protein n=1 Tax=Marinivivus vitaminiproducens TaxID=3035935 RepID=UPI0027999686|nr:molybdopterin oxidoreductase family protein [Geminicoccaceae bacterium SCSIO 64248]